MGVNVGLQCMCNVGPARAPKLLQITTITPVYGSYNQISKELYIDQLSYLGGPALYMYLHIHIYIYTWMDGWMDGWMDR